jgi:hypothetical protein
MRRRIDIHFFGSFLSNDHSSLHPRKKKQRFGGTSCTPSKNTTNCVLCFPCGVLPFERATRVIISKLTIESAFFGTANDREKKILFSVSNRKFLFSLAFFEIERICQIEKRSRKTKIFSLRHRISITNIFIDFFLHSAK